MKDDEFNKASTMFFALTILFVFIGIIASFFLMGCTLSLQNIDTHGTATDLVDEVQTTTPRISTNLKTDALK